MDESAQILKQFFEYKRQLNAIERKEDLIAFPIDELNLFIGEELSEIDVILFLSMFIKSVL